MKTTNIIKTAVWIALLAGMSVAQSQTEVPKAAVYIMGNPEGRDALRMAVNNYLIKSGRYQMIAVDAIDVLAKEHIRQMSGSVSDAQIAKLGQDAGAEYVCVVERTELDGVSYVATRMVSVENKVADLSEMAVLPKGGIIIDFVKKQIEAMLGMDVASKPAIYKPTYTITANVNPIDGGTVSRNPNQTYYAQGTVVSVTAIPADGYEFTGWSGAATSTKATLTAPIDRDLILTANFRYVQQTYTLTTNVFPSGCGYVSRSPYKETYAVGEEVDLRATPYSGYAFSGWTGVPNGLRSSTVIKMNEDKTVTANFYRKSLSTPTYQSSTPEPRYETSYSYYDTKEYRANIKKGNLTAAGHKSVTGFLIGFGGNVGYNESSLDDGGHVAGQLGIVHSRPISERIVSLNVEGNILAGQAFSDFLDNDFFFGFNMPLTVLLQLKLFSLEAGVDGDLLFCDDLMLLNAGFVVGVGFLGNIQQISSWYSGYHNKKESARFFYRYCGGIKYSKGHLFGFWYLF